MERRGGCRRSGHTSSSMMELVYDLIYPTQMVTHLSTIDELDDRSIDSTKSLSSFASVDESQLEEEVDLDCSTGRETYLEKRAPTPMTKKAMKTNKPWPKRYDGLRHASLPVINRHCQYCYFQYTAVSPLINLEMQHDGRSARVG